MPARCGLSTEAEYAFTKHKRIVPLRLESGYFPDGWLGLMSLTRLYYDFSDPDPYKFEEEWSKLHAALKELKLSGAQLATKIPSYSVIDKKAQLSLTNPRDACEKFARFT